jgi:hypothetical protein
MLIESTLDTLGRVLLTPTLFSLERRFELDHQGSNPSLCRSTV